MFHSQRILIIVSGVALFGGALLAQSTSSPESRQPAPDTTERRPPRPPGTPVLLKDINPDGSSDAGGFVSIRGVTFFRANDGTRGAELWRTDGTADGTVLVQDIEAGAGSSAPDGLTWFNDRLYFAASTSATGREVWASDGTADGTVLVSDVNPGAADALPAVFVPFGDALYFRAQESATGLELWKTQGDADTTVQVADLHPGTEGSVPTYPVVFGGALFFSADDSYTPGIGFDRELWRTDGTPAGTTRVKDINAGPAPSIPGEILRLGRQLIFKAGTAEVGGELWKSDGTEQGTTMVADMNPGPSSSFPTNLARVGREIFFAAGDAGSGRELWATDGTEAGTRRVADINPGPGDSSPMGIAFRDGYLFNAGDAEHGRELWFSDGTAAGTRLVKDINPGPANASPLLITATPSGDEAYFAIIRQTDAGDGTVTTELWRTDGTDAGTQAVWEAPGRLNGYSIRELTVAGGAVLFTAPTQVDANGIAIDFEPYVLPIRDDRQTTLTTR